MSSFMFGIPYIRSPPGRSELSKTVTECPRRFSISAQASPEGPEPTTGNALSGAYFRYSRFYKTFFKAVFDYVKLVVADCDRVAVQSAGAGGFAERGADPSGEFREG